MKFGKFWPKNDLENPSNQKLKIRLSTSLDSHKIYPETHSQYGNPSDCDSATESDPESPARHYLDFFSSFFERTK